MARAGFAGLWISKFVVEITKLTTLRSLFQQYAGEFLNKSAIYALIDHFVLGSIFRGRSTQ